MEISQRAREVAEQLTARLVGHPIHCLRDSQPLLLNEAANLIQIQLTAQALESRNATLREAAGVAKQHKERTMKQAQEALEQGEVLLGHRQLMCEVIEYAILALIKE